MSLNLFVRNDLSMASRLTQDKWYLALDVGKCSQICDHVSYMQHTPSICPGKAFGDMNVWLAVASITACFRITSSGVLGDPKITSGFSS